MRQALIGLSFFVVLPSLAHAQIPAAIAAPGETAVATWHAEGAQVYECKAGADGKFAWAFREPIATLLLDGKTIGRHYAGPNWEHMDGSAIVGKVAANAPGATPKDIPLLKLEVTSSRGSGVFVRRHDRAAHQHVGRPPRGRLREGGCVPRRALRSGLRVPEEVAPRLRSAPVPCRRT